MSKKTALAKICSECKKVTECISSMRFDPKLMYCSDYKKSHNMNKEDIPQIEFNIMRIALDMEDCNE